MPIKTNWRTVLDGLEDQTRTALQEILGDTADTLDGEVRRISRMILMAARYDRPDLVAEAKDSLLLILQEKDIKARKQFDAILDTVIGIAFNGLFTGLATGLRAITVL